MTLDGKTALITGGSRGIGAAIVRRLARDGARVVFGYREGKDAAEALVAEVPNSTAVRADLADPGALDDLFGAVEDGLDILVNNAAINPLTPLAEITGPGFDRVMAVNARFPLLAMARAAETMRDGGRIINISTLNTVIPVPQLALYIGSKAALEGYTAVAARELGPRGITVNAVSPGATETDMLRESNPPEALEQTAGFTALGRLGRPEDIADVVAYLAGPDSGWITGQNLRATGGMIV